MKENPEAEFVSLTKQGERRIPNGKAGSIWKVKNFTKGIGDYYCAHVIETDDDGEQKSIWSLGQGDWQPLDEERDDADIRAWIAKACRFDKDAAGCDDIIEDRYSLRDEGRNDDGTGLSYGERQ